MKDKLVLVGNGMAGVRTLEELLKIAPDKYDITVFGAEPYGNYNRIMLSPVLAGEKTVDDIMLNDEQWYIDNGITLHKGKTSSRNRSRKQKGHRSRRHRRRLRPPVAGNRLQPVHDPGARQGQGRRHCLP